MWPIIAILILVVLLVLLALAFLFRDNQSSARLSLIYHEDGLWDLYLGSILLLLGIAEWLELSVVGFVPVLLYPLLLAAKQAITAPRLRPVDLPPARSTQRRTIPWIALGLVFLLGLVVFVLPANDLPLWLKSALDRYLMTVLWLLVIGVLAVQGYCSGVPRLIGYAVLFLAALLVSFWVDLPIYLYAFVLGAIICASGLAVMVHFVHDHPKLASGRGA